MNTEQIIEKDELSEDERAFVLAELIKSTKVDPDERYGYGYDRSNIPGSFYGWSNDLKPEAKTKLLRILSKMDSESLQRFFGLFNFKWDTEQWNPASAEKEEVKLRIMNGWRATKKSCLERIRKYLEAVNFNFAEEKE